MSFSNNNNTPPVPPRKSLGGGDTSHLRSGNSSSSSSSATNSRNHIKHGSNSVYAPLMHYPPQICLPSLLRSAKQLSVVLDMLNVPNPDAIPDCIKVKYDTSIEEEFLRRRQEHYQREEQRLKKEEEERERKELERQRQLAALQQSTRNEILLPERASPIPIVSEVGSLTSPLTSADSLPLVPSAILGGDTSSSASNPNVNNSSSATNSPLNATEVVSSSSTLVNGHPANHDSQSNCFSNGSLPSPSATTTTATTVRKLENYREFEPGFSPPDPWEVPRNPNEELIDILAANFQSATTVSTPNTSTHVSVPAAAAPVSPRLHVNKNNGNNNNSDNTYHSNSGGSETLPHHRPAHIPSNAVRLPVPAHGFILPSTTPTYHPSQAHPPIPAPKPAIYNRMGNETSENNRLSKCQRLATEHRLSVPGVEHALKLYGENDTENVIKFGRQFDKLAPLGFAKNGVVHACTLYPDDSEKALDFLESFTKLSEFGFEELRIVGALKANNNNFEQSLETLM